MPKSEEGSTPFPIGRAGGKAGRAAAWDMGDLGRFGAGRILVGWIHPAWTSLSQADHQVKGRIAVRLQLLARSLISTGDFYYICSDFH